MFSGRKAEWNGGWEGMDPLPYTVLSEEDFNAHLERLSFHCKHGTADCVTFQPFPIAHHNQDRYAVHEWVVAGETWKLWGVFDGHAGHATVDYTVRVLPQTIMSRITTLAQSQSDPSASIAVPAPADITTLLSRTIIEFDDAITQGVHDLFPGGPSSVAAMPRDAIVERVLISGAAHPIISLCLTGTTVLVAVLDPRRNLYVACLGDCSAVLGTRSTDGAWKAELVSTQHNGREEVEVQRIRSEHPGEPECVLNDRVLGGIAVTRAIGDHVFKLPPLYTQRVFDTADPSAYIFKRLVNILERNLTPPYVSNVPDVRHVDLSAYAPVDTVLIMASDGLADLYEAERDLENAARRWVHTVTTATQNPAVQLLCTGMAGGDVEKASWYLTAEMDSPWVDDITILVDNL